jgi:ArsR family transcriptional regulator
MFVNTSLEVAMTVRTGTRLTVADCCSVLEEPVSDARAEELARGFAALADPVRLRLFSMIASAGTCCSCDLVEPIGKSQPTVSHHTKVLADAGLITGEKIGRWVNWTVVPERLEQLRAALAT